MPSVYIVGGDRLIERMFRDKGWGISSFSGTPDLIQFTGGADIDPSYYGEEKHATTWSNPKRDAEEAHIFNSNRGVAMAGICRGGQLLNVLLGGSMYQHVNNHSSGRLHKARTPEGQELMVTSTHHQMMRPTEAAEWLLEASVSTRRETATSVDTTTGFRDCEVVLYENDRCLCFQPHPEYLSDDDPCVEFYFKALERIL